MKTGPSIFTHLIKNLFFDVGFMGIANGVWQGLYTIYLERKDEFTSLLSSAMEELQQ